MVERIMISATTTKENKARVDHLYLSMNSSTIKIVSAKTRARPKEKT
jgi:hypothetical protein